MPGRADFIVIGQGLAGTVLAWQLRAAGATVVILDRDDGPTASRVAAGLLTPVTGQRLALSWRFPEAWPAAVAFYRRAEAETGATFFHPRVMLRLFADPTERAAYEGRADTLLAGAVRGIETPVDPGAIVAPHGGFEMPDAGQLDVPAFLDVSRAAFAAAGRFVRAAVDPAADVVVTGGGVSLPRLGLTADGVVFCEGFGPRPNPWFPHVRFNPVKGEILTLHIPGLRDDRVFHRGAWLAPVPGADGLYRAGATYDRGTTDCTPTDRGRGEVCERVRAFVRAAFDVVGHAAAVRPVIRAGRPVIGTHPGHGRRVGYFNGLGSKGALLAPLLAGQLARHLLAGDPLDPEVDLSLLKRPK